MNEDKLRQVLQETLSRETFTGQPKVLDAIKGEKTMNPRKLSAALVCAMILTLLMMGAALAAAFGLFGSFSREPENLYAANRLQKLDEVSETVCLGASLSAPGPEASVSQPETDCEALVLRQYERTFDLTVHQSYCDGKRLFFSYTLKTNLADTFRGEGMPTGVSEWLIDEPGRRYEEVWSHDDPVLDKTISQWLNAHESSWIAYESWSLGDGARLMDGSHCDIFGSDTRMTDPLTIEGYQEIRLPESYAMDDSVTIELSVLYGTALYHQDETGVRWAHIAQPENRGILRIPVTVQRSGSTQMLSGEGTFDQYSANAQLQLSQVELSGTVRLLCPAEWTEDPADLHESSDVLSHYVLVANGHTLPNLDASMRVNGPGRLTLSVRFDLPQDPGSLALRPVYFQSGEHPQEDIPLR